MALASDLMGLGLPPALALSVSEGGAGVAGSLTITALGNSFATAAPIRVDRRLVVCSTGNNTLALALPAVTGNVSLGDQYKIINAGATDTVVVWASSGVTICARGTNTSFALVAPNSTLCVFPVTAGSTATWAGWHA